MWYPYETHFKLKYREIKFIHNIDFQNDEATVSEFSNQTLQRSHQVIACNHKSCLKIVVYSHEFEMDCLSKIGHSIPFMGWLL